jgi:tRNA (cmo5U34)-methyltransferase
MRSRITGEVWKDPDLARRFVTGVRGGLPFAAAQMDVLLRVVEARGRPVRAVTDLGCGDGILAAAILSRYPRAAATLVDFSESMLERARDRFQGNRRVAFVTADFGKRGWTEAVAGRAPFDVVVSGYAIHHQPDARKRRIYREIFGLLAPGGTFVNVEHVSSSTEWVKSVSDGMFIDSLYELHRPKKTRAQVAREFVHRPDKAANILAPVEEQCRWLRRCGFEDVDCYFKASEAGGRNKTFSPQRHQGTKKDQRV